MYEVRRIDGSWLVQNSSVNTVHAVGIDKRDDALAIAAILNGESPMIGYTDIIKGLRRDFPDVSFVANYEICAYCFVAESKPFACKWSLHVMTSNPTETQWNEDHESLAVLASRYREWVQTRDMAEVDGKSDGPYAWDQTPADARDI